jgi:hypothetical protein
MFDPIVGGGKNSTRGDRLSKHLIPTIRKLRYDLVLSQAQGRRREYETNETKRNKRKRALFRLFRLFWFVSYSLLACDSEGQPQSEAELPFREVSIGAGDHHEVGSGHVGIARVAEVRRVGEVERLRTELNPEPLSDRENTEQREIEVLQSRAAQDVASRRAEADGGNIRERRWVEVTLVGHAGNGSADSAELLDIRLHLVRRLSVARSIKRCAGSGNIERPARNQAQDAIDLPIAEQGSRHSILCQLLTFAEGKLRGKAELEVVWYIITGQGAVTAYLRRSIEQRESVRAGVVHHIDRLRPGVGAFDEQPLRHAAIDRHLQGVVVRAGEAVPQVGPLWRSSGPLVPGMPSTSRPIFVP